ncbi:MAG: MG2 domain-containing protein [Acidobacteriota bacterium]
MAAAGRWKDLLIAGLALAVLVLGGLLWQRGAEADRDRPPENAVSLFDLVLDREDRQFIDLVFDRPLGEGRLGEVFESPPATLNPSVGGSWRWRDRGILRFEASGRLPAATEIVLSLIPDRFLEEGQVFAGDRERRVVTDQFLVETVEVFEEPDPEGGEAKVIFRGELRFNYSVDPEDLAPLVTLQDGGQPVAVELETLWPSQVVGFRTAAVAKTKAERELELTVAAGLTPADGNVPLQEPFRQTVALGSRDRLAVRGLQAVPAESGSSLRVKLSSPVAASLAESFVGLEPKTEFRVSAVRNELILSGDLSPGQTYKVRLGAGLSASDGASLAEPWEQEVLLPNLDPLIDIRGAGMFLPRGGFRTLAVETVNVDRFRLALDRVYRNNLFGLLQSGSFSTTGGSGYASPVRHSLGDRLSNVEVRVRGGRNQRIETPVTLDRYIDADRPGVYRAVVTRRGDWRSTERWLLLTDLGVVAKNAGDEFLVLVTSLESLAPVAGARVRLISSQNQLLAEGRSDAQGLWRTRGLVAKLAEQNARPYLVTVERGDDLSFLLLDQARIDSTGLDVGGASLGARGYSAFLYGERDLYRPGETVEGLAILRDAALTAPTPLPVVLRHRDPQGRERDLLRATSDERGLVPFELELPAYALTGRHSLDLEVADQSVGRYLFQVEEFVPDRIKAAIEPAGQPGPGEELSFEVEGRYLFGPPGAGLPVEARVRLVDATFAPDGFGQFTFRNGDRRFEDRPLLSSEGTLDDEGRQRFAVAVPFGLTAPSSLEAVITARVSERGGRGVTARQRMTVHPVPRYPGLRKVESGYADPGEQTAFELVMVAPDGELAAAGSLRAELFRDRWNTVLRRAPEGTFRYESSRESSLVDSRALATQGGRETFSFVPPETGSYRVVVTDLESSASSEIGFYASGWGYAPWAIDNPARVELDLDRDEYRPGSTATVQVRAPFPGRLLLTVERDQIFHTQVHTLDGNTATLEVPIGEALRPNAYVTAVLVRNASDLGDGEVTRAFGAVPISVDRSSNRLPLTVEAPAQIRSGTTLAVAVEAAPGAAVTVAAVDEGILQLAGQSTPDPFAFFYRKLGLAVQSFDGFSLLLPEVPVAGEQAVGGGDAAAAMAQYVQSEGLRRVRPVAFWSGPLVADGSGRVEAEFEVPDFQGALRIMTLGVDGRRFESRQQTVVVRDPLIVTPTFPRFLAWGDEAEIPLAVRNDTGREGDFRIVLAAGGETLGETSLVVADGAEAVTHLALAGERGSRVRELTVVVTGNDEKASARVSLPQRSHLPYRTLETAGPVGEAAMELPAPGDWAEDGTLERELRLGPLPLVQFAGKLSGLLRYPYGCLEQTVSAAFPLVYLEDLARQLEPGLFDIEGRPSPAAAVEEGIRRVGALQSYTGGFTLWPGADESHPWGSVWAAHFLVEARRAGFGVEGFLYDGALRYTSGLARAKSQYGSDELERAAYALFVLARAGRADLGTMDFLRQQKQGDLSPASQALLAAAYAARGDADAADELVRQIGEVEEVARASGGNFSSPLRDRALLLLALLEARANDPRISELADRLARDLSRRHGWTTQESAFALLALGELYRRQSEGPDYRGTVEVGGRSLGDFERAIEAFPSIAGRQPIAVKITEGFAPGAAFFSLRTRGLPKDSAFRPESSGLEIEREFFDRERRSVDPRRIQQGDLVVIKTRVRSIAGPVENVVLQSLLPAGLEVENPRLESTETLPWISDANASPDYVDLRDDRLLVFLDLPANQWQTLYSLARAIVPGQFRLPPPEAEAMYNPALRAVGEAGSLEVSKRIP